MNFSQIDPESTRRGGVAHVPCRLADGRLWGLARPGPRLVPILAGGEVGSGSSPRVTVGRAYGYPLSIERRIGELLSELETGSPSGQFEAFLSLAVALLRRVHDIDQQSAESLLNVAEGEFPRLVGEVLALACGEPKGPEGEAMPC